MIRAVVAAVGTAALMGASLPAQAAPMFPEKPTVDSGYALVQLSGAPLVGEGDRAPGQHELRDPDGCQPVDTIGCQLVNSLP